MSGLFTTRSMDLEYNSTISGVSDITFLNQFQKIYNIVFILEFYQILEVECFCSPKSPTFYF